MDTILIQGPFTNLGDLCEPVLRSLPEWFGIEEAISQDVYVRTRRFYLAMGFRPMEEFTQIWDASNPCLIMIKKVASE
jgi:hypothetical protein